MHCVSGPGAWCSSFITRTTTKLSLRPLDFASFQVLTSHISGTSHMLESRRFSFWLSKLSLSRRDGLVLATSVCWNYWFTHLDIGELRESWCALREFWSVYGHLGAVDLRESWLVLIGFKAILVKYSCHTLWFVLRWRHSHLWTLYSTGRREAYSYLVVKWAGSDWCRHFSGAVGSKRTPRYSHQGLACTCNLLHACSYLLMQLVPYLLSIISSLNILLAFSEYK